MAEGNERKKKVWEAVKNDEYFKDNDSPFEPWIIQEVSDEKYAEIEEREKTAKASNTSNLSKDEKLKKVREMLESKIKTPDSKESKENDEKNKLSKEDETRLEKKSQETGISVEALKLIEESKRKLRKNKN